MTQTSHLTSGAITNLNAVPPTANTAGEGAAGYLLSIFGYVTAVAADAAATTYQLVRLPTTAKLKELHFQSEAQGAGKVQLGLYYANAGSPDGTPQADVTTAPTVVTDQSSVSQVNLFSGDIDCASAVTPSDRLGVTGTFLWTMDMINKPLWQAANLASDPGGFFDIVATVHTTAVTTGTGKIGVEARYC